MSNTTLYTVQGTRMTGIADAVRKMRQESGALTPAQIQSEIENTRIGIPVDMVGHITDNGHWIRPNNYPDLDVLYNTIGDNESKVYLTYDLTKTPGYGWIGIYANYSQWYVERGHIENGAFVADWTSSAQAGGTIFRQALDSANGDVQLWCGRSSGTITRLGFASDTDTNSTSKFNNLQPCVERCGKLPDLTNLSSGVAANATSLAFSTRWLYRDHIMVGKKSVVTNMSGMYSYSLNLVETNCGEWKTDAWKVTSLDSTFMQCPYLQVLDLSGWNTSLWKVTSLSSTWASCTSLRVLDVSTWDTSNWTTLVYLNTTWYRCCSLKELDLSGWDVSAWRPTSLQNTWSICTSLQKLDVSTWDTSDWETTMFDSAWNYCSSLTKLPIENWDVSNWAVTRFDNAWSVCLSLRELDLSDWDVSGWRVTTFSNAWNNCESLVSLNVSTWNTSLWSVTTIASTWNNCRSLQELDLSHWDVSNWAVTTLASTWQGCFALRSIGFENWDTSNWAVTSLSATFQYCMSMQSFDLTKWNTSNWAVTTMYYTFPFTTNAKKIDISTWDISKFALTDTRYLFNDTFAEEVRFPSGLHGTVTNAKFTFNFMNLIFYSGMDIDIAMNFSNTVRLTHDSLVSIIGRLPTVSTSTTLTLGQTNKLKLTAEEIAVATQKGWTVA